jgi:hypothetical protein
MSLMRVIRMRLNEHNGSINETGIVLVLEGRAQDIEGIEDWPSNNRRSSVLHKHELSEYVLVRPQCMDRCDIRH